MTGIMTGIRQMKLPKYIRERNGTYHYQRDFPVRLRHLSGRKTFTFPLKLAVSSATELQIKKRAIEADEAFERTVLLMQNSNPDALSIADIDKTALDFLRSRGLRPGCFTNLFLEANSEGITHNIGTDAADGAIPEIEAISNKIDDSKALTLQDRVIVQAYKKLIDKEKAKPQTLSNLWD
jgi:hypothetical protein